MTQDEVIACFPEEEVREKFLARPDIAALPSEERQRRWEEHWPKATAFLERIAGMNPVVIDVPRRASP